jgi:hypothetical protein
MPVTWRRGWQARIAYAGRDRDGSLLAHILVSGPSGKQQWLQKVRLVPERRMNLHHR